MAKKKQSNRGAPTKPPEERKSALLLIRLTEADKTLIESAADGKPATWARDVLVKAAKRKSR